MTVFEWQADVALDATKILAHFVDTTDPTKLDWCPSTGPESETRSVLDQVRECASIYLRAAAALQGLPKPDAPALPTSAAESHDLLMRSVEQYTDAVRDLTDEVLGKEFDLGFGKVSGAFVITMPIMNTVYHGGQVCYIQTLYGDTNFSFPPDM